MLGDEGPPLIYDCCLFSGEIEHLLIRMTELNDVVDHFVVVECDVSFQGDHKGWTLPWHMGGPLAPWADKIVPILIHDPVPDAGRGGLGNDGFMVRERATRDAMQRGYLGKAHVNDLILVSDADEIPTVAGIQEAWTRLNQTERCILFRQNMYVWNRSWLWPGPSWNTCAYLAGSAITPQEARDLRGTMVERNQVVVDGGWHLTWQGGEEENRSKLLSFSHAEHLDKLESLGDRAEWGVDINGVALQPVDIDKTVWPVYFNDHPELWR